MVFDKKHFTNIDNMMKREEFWSMYSITDQICEKPAMIQSHHLPIYQQIHLQKMLQLTHQKDMNIS